MTIGIPTLYPYFLYHVTVQPEDIDEMGHANNVCYVRWMQDAATAHSTANGWSTERYFQYGMAWVARRHTIEYLQPAYPGDELIIRTGVADFKTVRSTRRYQFFRKSDGQLLAKAETLWAFVSIETHKPIKIHPEVAACFVVCDLASLPDNPLVSAECKVQNAK